MESSTKILLLIAASVLVLGLYIYYVWYYQSVPQAGISLLSSIPAPKAEDRILIFSPHPDDETIAVGGYIKVATSVGAKVWITLVTDGNKHHLEATRYNEFSTVTGFLGVPSENLTYLNYPDGKLHNENQIAVIENFKNIIIKDEPNIIFIPHPNDRHLDHKYTGLDAERAISESGLKPQVYYYLVHFPRFPLPDGLKKNFYLLPPLKLLSISKEWLSFPLADGVENTKFEALMKYKTQLRFLPLKELIEAFVRRNELFAVNK